MESEDLYSILNVSHTANRIEIRKAYCRLAKKCHPDKHPEDPIKASRMFQKIEFAYSTLYDCKKRSFYDILHSLKINKHHTPKNSSEYLLGSLKISLNKTRKEAADMDEQLYECYLDSKKPVKFEKECEEEYNEEEALEWLFS